MTFLFFIIGAVVGSFLGALTWRWPRNTSVLGGRSMCPNCKHTIRGYDNIPIISFLLLRGRCRDCKKKIPRRDFIIEVSTALIFAGSYLTLPQVSQNLPWLLTMNSIALLVVFYIVTSLAISIFIVDFEHQYIPDILAFMLAGVVLFSLLVTNNSQIFYYLLSGFGAAFFLLLINLVTLGRGMGLGDVKLALALGLALGFPLVVIWMFVSFVLGSVIGIMLIILKAAKFKQRIAFGPFLIAGFFLSMLFGSTLLNWFAIL
jgi:prepilin signal peptidase PulO-like enzyme (type II secretory pathway)